MDDNMNGPAETEKDKPIKRTVTLHGRTMTLMGEEIKVGSTAPDFKVTDNEMLPMKFLRTYKGKVSVILSVPSLDTQVCDIETRRFNQEAEALGP